MADITKCAGLFTFFSELEEPVGALVKADNVVVDKDDTINPRRGLKAYGTALPLTTDRLKQVIQYKDRLIRHYSTILQYDNGSGTFAAFSGSYSELESGLRIKYQEANGNLYFTTTAGIKKISASAASEFVTTSNYITGAGVPKALDVRGLLVVASGGFLTSQSKVAYRIVWGTKDINNNLLLGSPSSRLVVSNNTENVQSSSATFTNPIGPGDYFLLDFYNGVTTARYFVYYGATVADIPRMADTVNRTDIFVLNTGVDATADATNTANELSNVLGTTGISVSVATGTVTITPTSPLSTITLTPAAAPSGDIAVANNVISATKAANVELTFAVPAGITTNHFYQIYRTEVVQITGTETLDDIDPGEEFQLVDENFYVTGTSITVTELSPESFRQTGAPLYTNPQSGQGILQANERPPVAKDLALFRGSMFYSNTKTVHRKQFNLLAVSDFVSGSSKITIGNSTAAREYTLRGEKEVTTITTASTTNTVAAGYFTLNSASNERKYYLWMDTTGSTPDPLVASRIGIRVNLSVVADSQTGSALAIFNAMSGIADFACVNNGTTVTLTAFKNGNVDIPTKVSLVSTWAFAVGTEGDGEDSASNEVLLSSLSSVGQAIDETALSLVNIINLDTSGVVYAYYLSGAEDLPGNILLESRNLTDTAFYCAVSHTGLTDNFTPDFPLVKVATGINATGDVITFAAHGLSIGNKVYFYGTDSTPVILGEYTVASVPSVDTFTLTGTAITVNGTTGKFFLASVKSDNETNANRLYFSKTDQPEAVPILNYLDIGPRNKEIKRIIALRDNLFVLKEDGVYIVSGASAQNSNLTTSAGFGSKLLSNSTQILAPDSAQVLNNQIYMLSNKGVVSISESGGDEIKSRQIENLITSIANSRFTSYKTISFGVSYENDNAYMLWLPTTTSDTVATQCYRFNTLTRTWTRFVKSTTCGTVLSADDKLYMGAGDDEYLLQERKNGDRTDHVDGEVTLSIPPNGINGTTFELSSLSEVVEGDVLIQTQYVSIAFFNRLLRKLDLDPGPSSDAFESTLLMSAGNNLQTKLQALDTMLQANVTGYTTTSFSADFATIQTEYATMISKLNDAATTGVFFKDYAASSGTVPYEVLITDLLPNNKVTTNLSSNFMEGTVTLYKAFTKTVVWQPIHFDAVSTFKQVREGTILFDQNNFYSASIFYSTDLSQNFEEIEIFGQGVGSWGEFAFGDVNFGGGGSDEGGRTYLPRNKQRCRYVNVKFEHKNARETFSVLGVTLVPRDFSTKAYR